MGRLEAPLLLSFAVEHVNPSDRFDIGDLAQVHLRGLQVRMPQEDFRYNFERNAVSTCIGRRVPPQIMGPDAYVHLLAQLLDEGSCGRVAYGEDRMISGELLSRDIASQSCGCDLWHECHFPFTT